MSRVLGWFAASLVMFIFVVAAAAQNPVTRYTIRDQQAARATLLRASDFGSPSWHGGMVKPDTSGNCPGYAPYHPKQSDLVRTGLAESDFADGESSANVQVAVLQSLSMVKLDWQREVENAAFVECTRRAFQHVPGVRSIARIALLPFPSVGDRSAQIRAILVVGQKNAKARYRYEAQWVVLTRGRLEISFLSIAPYAQRAQAEQRTVRLVHLLDTRAKTQ